MEETSLLEGAFMKKKFPTHLIHGHTAEEIQKRLKQRTKHSYLRDFVYGSIDGAITTFAVVSGVVGAGLQTRTILILGMANLVADGFSMAASNYVGTKTEVAELELIKSYEHFQIKENPEGEKEELRQILSSKGLKGHSLEEAVKLIATDQSQWVNLMLTEEYGMAREIRSPIKAGSITFLGFILFGLIPLFPYLFQIANAFWGASLATGASFFLIGMFKGRWSIEATWLSGVKTFIIGSSAAALSYILGSVLKETF